MSQPPRGLGFAFEIASLGYRVFPLRWPSKRPAIRGWQTRASSDPIEVEAMWTERPDSAVGVATGPVLAIDLDEKDGKNGTLNWEQWCIANTVEIPEIAQKTLSGGAHVLYMMGAEDDFGLSSGTLPPGIDVRGNGGLIAVYQTLPEVSQLTTVPEALRAALRRPERRERPATGVTVRDPALGVHPYAERAVGYELARLDELAREGWDGPGWNNTVYAVACCLIEIENSRWAGYSSAHADLFGRAPQDPGFGLAEIQKIWESAVQKVGDGDRAEPEGSYLTPQEVFDVWEDETLHRIFDATPVLQHIRQAAHSRMIGSGAVLVNVLGRVLAEVPPGVVLPPVIGSTASLNLGFALVGQSGDGKSAAFKCGAEVLGIPQKHIEIGVGSGEGLIEAFLEEQRIPDPKDPTKTILKKMLVDPPSRILNVDEIEQLTRASGRDGSTIMSILRTAVTGGALKSANATADRRRSVEADSYRIVAFMGVQPTKSGPILNDADAGTPQRLLWVSTIDKTVPPIDERPDWPGSLDWAGGIVLLDDHQVDYPDHVKELLLQQRYERVHGRGDPLESHVMLTRLKVAAALAFLHDEISITDKWWEISGYLMEWSQKEQRKCLASLGEANAESAKARGRADAVQEMATEEERLSLVKKRLLEILSPESLYWATAMAKFSAKQREVFEQAVSELVEENSLVVESLEVRGQPARKLSIP